MAVLSRRERRIQSLFQDAACRFCEARIGHFHLAACGNRRLSNAAFAHGITHGTYGDLGRYYVSPDRQDVMSAKDRELAESAFDKNKRREAEINSALQQEHAKHEAAVKNMHRLRSLRLQRDAQTPPSTQNPPAKKKRVSH
jgi:hypothetical protein